MSNNMQRVYDHLAAVGAQSVAEIAAALHFTQAMALRAIERLRRQRCTTSTFVDGAWRYGIRNDAYRPVDHRGRKRA